MGDYITITSKRLDQYVTQMGHNICNLFSYDCGKSEGSEWRSSRHHLFILLVINRPGHVGPSASVS